METALSRKMRLTLAAAAVTFLAACGGDANEQGAATPDSAAQPTVGAAPSDVGGGVNPQEAVAFMAAANQSEVQAAQVAIDKASNAEVRRFAQKMRTEHSNSARQIGELARRMNITLDTAAQAQQGQMVASLRQAAQQMSQQLNSTPRGAQFDRVYIDGQVQAHQMVLENLQRIAGTSGAAGAAPAQPPGGAGRDTAQGAATPQQAAQMMIPHVQQHLDEARQIQTRLQGGGR